MLDMLFHCLAKFIAEKEVVTYKILMTVVTFNLFNTLIEDLAMPCIEVFVPDKYLDDLNIVMRHGTAVSSPIVIRGSRVIKKIVMWFLFMCLLAFFICR